MPYLTRPYVLWLEYRGSSAPLVKELTVAEARVAASYALLDMVSRRVPRSRCTALDVELRYVDPRPDAPWCVSPQAQAQED